MRRKIILLFVSVITLLLTIISFTFAWFSSNITTYLTNLNIEVKTANGVYISTDGYNYSQNVSLSKIKEAIVAKNKGYKYVDGILVDKDDVRVNLSYEDIDKLFSEIVLKPVTSLDGKTFYKDKSYLMKSNLQDGTYISFDLYFKALDDSTNVYFNSNDYSYYEDGTHLKRTSINSEIIKTTNDDSKVNYLFTSLNVFDSLGELKTISKGEENLAIGAKDAIRFSVEDEDVKIYELNEGLGSYATDLDSNQYKDSSMYLKASSYDSQKNASFTYVNNLLNDVSKFKPLSYSNVPNTYKDLNYLESGMICKNLNKNEVAKKTFTFWLEGYDADCFDAIISSKISIDLSFTTNAYSLYERLKHVNYHIDENVIERTYYDYEYIKDIILPYDNNKKFKSWVDKNNLEFDFNKVKGSLDSEFDVYALFE